METKKLLANLILSVLLFFSTGVNAQVTIGADAIPEKAALLDVKDQVPATPGDATSTTGGILFPRVYLQKHNALLPFFTPADTTSVDYKNVQKPAHTGLFVYNLFDDSDDVNGQGFEPGPYYWDGEKWLRMEKARTPAILSIEDCSRDISVFGSYGNDVALDGSNFIRVTVIVSKPGYYTLTATAAIDNGYFFHTSGEFFSSGTYQIVVPGMGKPVNHGADRFTVLLNDKGENGNNPACTFDVNVKNTSVRPRYGMDCSLTTLSGEYYEEQRLNSTHYIDITLNVESGSSGAEWEIHTNEVDGIKFSGSGTLGNASSQTVRIYGEGVPFDIRDKQFYIISNSESSTATCQTTVFMIIPPKRVMTIGAASVYGYNLGQSYTDYSTYVNYPNRMLTDKNNFGPYRHSIVRYAGFTNRTGSTGNQITATGADHGGSIVQLTDAVSTNMTAARFGDYLFGRTGYPKMDMVIIGYSSNMFAAGTGYAAKADSLIKFMEQGGIVLMFCEAQSSNQALLRKVFKNDAVTVTAGSGAGSRYKLGYDGSDESMRQFYAKSDDPILVGPFANISGSLVGEDASTTYFADNLPMDQVVLYAGPNEVGRTAASRSNSGATIFRHQSLPFVWSGDGGFNSSNGTSQNFDTDGNENICPFKLQTRTINGQIYPNYPTYRKNFGGGANYVYNAVFTANAIAWCIQKSEELRKGKR